MDAVVTQMLTFCVSVCYKNGCNDYTDVNILRNRMPQDGCSGYTGVNMCVPYATKMDAVVTLMLLTCFRIRMLQKWMQWLHGC